MEPSETFGPDFSRPGAFNEAGLAAWTQQSHGGTSTSPPAAPSGSGAPRTWAQLAPVCPRACEGWAVRAARRKERGRAPREGQRRRRESEYPVSSCAMQRGVILLRPSAVRVSTCFFKRFWQRRETNERRVSACERARPARTRAQLPTRQPFGRNQSEPLVQDVCSTSP